jgi:hypothetical protein
MFEESNLVFTGPIRGGQRGQFAPGPQCKGGGGANLENKKNNVERFLI